MNLLKLLKSKRAEAYIGTGVKIITAVIVGAVLLGGLLLLFTGNNGIFTNLNRKVQDMINTDKDPVLFSYDIGSESLTSLQYTYDRTAWIPSEVPTYSENAVIVKHFSNIGTTAPASLIVVEDNSNVYLLASSDNGATWTEVRSCGTVNRTDRIVTYSLTYTQSKGYYFLIKQMNKTTSGGWGNEFGSTDGIKWTPLSLGIHYF